MNCYVCGSRLSEVDYCTACGADVGKYKKIIYAANKYYNDGLQRAKVRDLSGAVNSLRQCLKFNKNHVEARNLLGLVYFETGETVAAFCEWVISKNMKKEKNLAEDYLSIMQSNQGRLETINTTIHKYNVALDLAKQGSVDMAVIQLKKVLNLNPRFLKAHKLLALLYIMQEEWEKARRELIRTQKIDVGDVDVLIYMQEVDRMLEGDDDKAGNSIKTKKDGPSSISTMNGHEMIIQPVRGKENIGLHALFQVGIGVVIGLLVTYFLIAPARVSSQKKADAQEMEGYVEEINTKNAEINELNLRITNLEQSALALQSDLDNYEGTNGTLEAYGYLMNAATAYLSGRQATEVETYLGLISQEFLSTNTNSSFTDLYEYLQSLIGVDVSDSYYASGITYYNQKDFALAIVDLTKAYQYDSTDVESLYYLALAYYESGDMGNARGCFEEVIQKFPETTLAEKAQGKIQELND
ncbi:MAG: tetratricopeptide repeat protein [Lachnospiraceae bacterium]|nr:tetratricopeptide repeat protein [Lachnospiraceae bacterium]